MKKTLIALSLVTLTAALIAFSAARWLRCHDDAAARGADLDDVGWLQRTLGLTDAQAGDIADLEDEFRVALETRCQAHCAARFALSEELAKTEPDLEKARALVERMIAVQAASERATLDHIMQVRNVLTDKQDQRYASVIHHQLCTACPLGLHVPPAKGAHSD